MLPDKVSKREEKGTTARAEGVADADVQSVPWRYVKVRGKRNYVLSWPRIRQQGHVTVIFIEVQQLPLLGHEPYAVVTIYEHVVLWVQAFKCGGVVAAFRQLDDVLEFHDEGSL